MTKGELLAALQDVPDGAQVEGLIGEIINTYPQMVLTTNLRIAKVLPRPYVGKVELFLDGRQEVRHAELDNPTYLGYLRGEPAPEVWSEFCPTCGAETAASKLKARLAGICPECKKRECPGRLSHELEAMAAGLKNVEAALKCGERKERGHGPGGM